MIFEVYYYTADDDSNNAQEKAVLITIDDDIVRYYNELPDVDPDVTPEDNGIIDEMDDAIRDQTGDEPSSVFFFPAKIWYDKTTKSLWINEPNVDGKGTPRRVTGDELAALGEQMAEIGLAVGKA